MIWFYNSKLFLSDISIDNGNNNQFVHLIYSIIYVYIFIYCTLYNFKFFLIWYVDPIEICRILCLDPYPSKVLEGLAIEGNNVDKLMVCL